MEQTVRAFLAEDSKEIEKVSEELIKGGYLITSITISDANSNSDWSGVWVAIIAQKGN